MDAIILSAKQIASKFSKELGFVNIAALEDAYNRGGLEVIPDIGMVCFHHRLDKQTTIREIAVVRNHQNLGWGRLLFYRVLSAAIERHQTSIFAKCPVESSSNNFYQKLGFILENTVQGRVRHLNCWRYKIKLPLLFYTGSGGYNKYDEIAESEGWLPGLRSTSVGKKHMMFVDNKWKPYNHHKHLSVVKKHKPLLATACDVLSLDDLPRILDEASELAKYCGRVLLIPKCEFDIPNGFWLAFSVPTGHGATTVKPIFFGNTPTHLLGGSPNNQAYYYHSLAKCVSLDQNYAMKSAKYGEVVCQDFRQKHIFKGTNFNYKALQLSLSWQIYLNLGTTLIA